MIIGRHWRGQYCLWDLVKLFWPHWLRKDCVTTRLEMVSYHFLSLRLFLLDETFSKLCWHTGVFPRGAAECKKRASDDGSQLKQRSDVRFCEHRLKLLISACLLFPSFTMIYSLNDCLWQRKRLRILHKQHLQFSYRTDPITIYDFSKPGITVYRFDPPAQTWNEEMRQVCQMRTKSSGLTPLSWQDSSSDSVFLKNKH